MVSTSWLRSGLIGTGLGLTLSLAATSALVAQEMRAVDDADGDAFFRAIQAIDPADGSPFVPDEFSTCPTAGGTEANTLFDGDGSNPIGFISGAAYAGGTLYVLDWDAAGAPPAIRLATITTDPGNGCASGEDVDPAQAIGFFNLESLAYCSDDETLYSVDFDDAAHQGQLVSIDRATGAGQEVAPGVHLTTDLRVVGLSCAEGTLWGVTSGFGARAPELLTIDRQAGTATVKGATGTANSTGAAPLIESLEVDRSSGSTRLLAAGPNLWEILDPENPVAAQVPGVSYRAVWGLTTVPEPLSELLAAFALLTLAWLARGRSSLPGRPTREPG